MGIQGLLQLVKPLIQPYHVKQLKGRRVAVDGYAWLHKAVYGCCVELCNGTESHLWITYCLNLVDLLLRHGIIVTLVFDGAPLQAKGVTEVGRESNRASSLSKAKDLAALGDHNAARSFYAKAVDVS